MKKSVDRRTQAAQLRQVMVRDAKQWAPGHAGQFVKRERIGRRGRKGALLYGTMPSAAGVIGDPAVALAYALRRALRPPDPRYDRGVCRRIDPTTGEVIGLIDPATRVETPVGPRPPRPAAKKGAA